MKNPKERSTAILVGVAAGAILMALMFMIVFGLHTGIAGVVLVLLIVAVSAISGWLIGFRISGDMCRITAVKRQHRKSCRGRKGLCF